MSDALLLLNASAARNFHQMNHYDSGLAQHAPSGSVSGSGSGSGSGIQLPSLNSILSKIQTEQKQPLPHPAGPSSFAVRSQQDSTMMLPSPNAPKTAPPPPPPQTFTLPAPHFILSSTSPSSTTPSASSSTSTVSSPDHLHQNAPPIFLVQSQPGASVATAPTSFPVPTFRAQIPLSQQSGAAYVADVSSKKHDKLSAAMRRYKCKVCDKTFTTSGHLARHTRIHTGVKNHVCPYEGCGARFSRQDNCMQHYKTHSNSKKIRKRGKSV